MIDVNQATKVEELQQCWDTTEPPDDIDEPKDLVMATKLVYAVRTIERKLLQEKETANQLKAEIDAHFNHKREQLGGQIDYLTGVLKGYAQVELHGKKERSIDTVAGRMGFRRLPDRVEVLELEKFWGWHSRFDEESGKQFVITTRKPALKPIHNFIKERGEVPDGCELTKGEDSFFVKTKNEPYRGEVNTDAE